MYSTSVISHPTISNVNNAKDQNRKMSGIPGADVDDAGGKSAGHLVTSSPHLLLLLLQELSQDQ